MKRHVPEKNACIRLVAVFLLFAGGAGCSPHRLTAQPEPVIAAGKDYAGKTLVNGGSLTGGRPWYETFQSPDLDRLIKTALEGSLPVREAMARLRQAEVLAEGARADRMPELLAEMGIAKEIDDGRTEATASDAGLSLSWEIDVFNRLGSLAAARRLEAKAAAEDVAALHLLLSAEVAEAWYGAVSEHLKIALLKQQIDADSELLDLIRRRHEAGIGTQVDVLQQESQLAEDQSLIPPAEAARRVFENRIDVLTGAAPDGIDRTAGTIRYAEIGDIPALGVPSDLLLNRPDLRAMKARLVAADAQIGVAIAERLPRITLTGSHGYGDTASSSGFSTALLAGLVQPVLDWGRRRAEVERNRALYDEELAVFSRVYLEAVEEVENTLYREGRQREHISRLETRRRLLDQTLKTAEAVYKQGESDYLPVLDAVKALRTTERVLVAERFSLILLRIRLFRAVGAPVMPQEDIP